MSDISTKTIKAVITNTTPTFKAGIVQKGADGKEIELQVTATHIQWRLTNGTWANLVALADLKGADGTNGIDGTDGVDGNGIVSITLTSGNHSPGTTDTYTITFTDATTTTFDVYNGADGAGAGDMLKSVYDTNNDGIVDNAEKVNGKTVEENVPSGAKFTDTIYTHPNHSGDVTSVADGAQTIANGAVTLAKMANMATNSIIGRITANAGAPEILSGASVRSIINVADGANNYSLPTATDNVLGGVKIGDGINIENGVINANDKANKTQENWISATLQNGFSASNSVGIKYAKNDMGMVTLHIEITSGTTVGAGTVVTILPVGYRPMADLVIPVYNLTSSSYSGQAFRVRASDGNFMVFTSSFAITSSTTYVTSYTFYAGI